MTTVERMLDASKHIWQAYNEHPFVLGIQNGTLDTEKFRYYIVQDYLYLEDYAKCFAIGVAKAHPDFRNVKMKKMGILASLQ